jgi:hypothetical protein
LELDSRRFLPTAEFNSLLGSDPTEVPTIVGMYFT